LLQAKTRLDSIEVIRAVENMHKYKDTRHDPVVKTFLNKAVEEVEEVDGWDNPSRQETVVSSWLPWDNPRYRSSANASLLQSLQYLHARARRYRG